MKIKADAFKVIDECENEVGVVRLVVNSDFLEAAANNFIDVDEIDSGRTMTIYDAINVTMDVLGVELTNERTVEETDEIVKSVEIDSLIEFDVRLTWTEEVDDDIVMNRGDARLKMNVKTSADFSNQHECGEVTWTIFSPVTADVTNEDYQWSFYGVSMVDLLQPAISLEIDTR